MPLPKTNSKGFELIEELGSGAFSVLYVARDRESNKEVAIKMEKQDKSRSVLIAEYQCLHHLKGKKGIIQVIDFVSQAHLNKPNFIVMELQGMSVQHYLQTQEPTVEKAVDLLIQMVDCLETTHETGILHRDVKPANFVLDDNKKEVFLVDFGLGKQHLDGDGEPYPPRTQTDFRGTIPYASLASHFNQELGRKDDLWSLFFIMLEMFG